MAEVNFEHHAEIQFISSLRINCKNSFWEKKNGIWQTLHLNFATYF